MSRDANFDAVLAAVKALNLVPAVDVTEWDGVIEVTKTTPNCPSIQVFYFGDTPGAPEGIGHVSYQRDHIFWLFINGSPSETRDIMDGLEDGLQGPLSGTTCVLKRTTDPDRNGYIDTDQTDFTYRMLFTLTDNFQQSF